MIKVRFAPSPTGYLHIGGARTALFNWMYARSQSGKFVLRIEDTDLQRSKKEYEDEILDSMQWLGLSWDELYYQSKRFDLYKEYAEKLLSEGKAYKEGEAILLKTNTKEIKIFDLIRGEIIFDTANFTQRKEDGTLELDKYGKPVLKDEVLIKADGSPVYSFCCVIDDALMEISHVIRGEDHISNTPKQILMYEALGFKPPKFAHLPLIMGEDGGRLSKRTGAVAVTDYRNEGFLPEAVINYLMLLGWSPGNDQEIISLPSAVKKFSIKKVNKAAAIFSMDKLIWLNGQYIKNLSTKDLTEQLIPFLKEVNFIDDNVDMAWLEKAVELYKDRTPTLKDFLTRAGFIFTEAFLLDEEAKEKHLKNDMKKEFKALADSLGKLDLFDATSCEKAFRETVANLSLTMSDLVHPVRVALTGSSIGPSLFHMMEVLGKEKTIKRLLKY